MRATTDNIIPTEPLFDIYVKEKDVLNIWGGSIDLDGENYVCIARNVPRESNSVVYIDRD